MTNSEGADELRGIMYHMKHVDHQGLVQHYAHMKNGNDSTVILPEKRHKVVLALTDEEGRLLEALSAVRAARSAFAGTK